jgi:hypothetical protein
MKISEAVKTLLFLKEKYGDVGIEIFDPETSDMTEPLFEHDTETNTVYIEVS